MKARSSLRRRVVIGVVCYTLLISLAITLQGYLVNEQVEQRIWESMLQAELTHWLQRRRDDANFQWRDTEALQMFGHDVSKSVPAEFAHLSPGVHDEIRRGNRQYVVLVQGAELDRLVLALDISDMERRESTLALAMVLSAVVLAVLLTGATYLGVNHLMSPLASLSRSIQNLRPDARRQRVDIEGSDPEEIAVIAEALNGYLQRIDNYVERERAFLNMASHELRMPIAVIAGAAELAIEQHSLEAVRPHVSRILWTSRDMQELVTLLLVLAKDPARLRANLAPVDLSKLVPSIVRDHAHLMQGKELSFVYGSMPAVEVQLPALIAQAAIGNLIRNAVENSSRGTIRVAIEASGAIVVEDSGTGMSAEELSRLYARLARSGERRGDGIGLDLITRLCEHLGWTLTLGSSPAGGTIARLNFNA